MNYDTFLGPALPSLGWVPAPRYLMRRARIKSLMRDVPIGYLLEVGPGAGGLLVEFSNDGFICEGLEASTDANNLTKNVVSEFGYDIPVHIKPLDEWNANFDVLCAFDVLEHIQEDQTALSLWHTWLKPGGQLFISVPAHSKMWTSGDEWAGHYRRYERDSFIELLISSGYEVESFECYGFPLTNLSEKFSAPIYKKKIYKDGQSADLDRKTNNDRSGIDRAPHLKLFPIISSPIGKLCLSFFYLIQKLFINTDLGSGYVIRARKK